MKHHAMATDDVFKKATQSATPSPPKPASELHNQLHNVESVVQNVVQSGTLGSIPESATTEDEKAKDSNPPGIYNVRPQEATSGGGSSFGMNRRGGTRTKSGRYIDLPGNSADSGIDGRKWRLFRPIFGQFGIGNRESKRSIRSVRH